MRKTLLTIVSIITVVSYGNEGSALKYYDNCIDRINCTTDQECYDKDTVCMEITEDLFYGKITSEKAEKMITENVEK